MIIFFLIFIAEEQGLEPQFADSKSAVLTIERFPNMAPHPGVEPGILRLEGSVGHPAREAKCVFIDDIKNQ